MHPASSGVNERRRINSQVRSKTFDMRLLARSRTARSIAMRGSTRDHVAEHVSHSESDGGGDAGDRQLARDRERERAAGEQRGADRDQAQTEKRGAQAREHRRAAAEE